MSRPRWFTDTGADHSRRYVERFRRMAAEGADLDGEARFVDAMIARHARVLDAGCGSGRVGAALAARGHSVVGVDVDPVLVAAAREDHAGPTWVQADLAELSAADEAALAEPFDAAVLAGNVLVYVTPDTEVAVLRSVAGLVRVGGVVIVGFATDRAYTTADLDRDLPLAGLVREHRFAGWDLSPWTDDAGWAVTVARVAHVP